MKNYKKSIVITALTFICLAGGFSTTAYGQEILQNVLSYFHVGNMAITQYDQELPEQNAGKLPDNENEGENRQNAVRENTEQNVTIQEARDLMKVNFAVPAWMPDGYEYRSSTMTGDDLAQLQFTNVDNESLVSLLISKSENGISTTGEVRKEVLGDTEVYFANGIVLWEKDGLTYELYQTDEEAFGIDTLEKMITELSSEETYE